MKQILVLTLALLSACGGTQNTPGSSSQVPESASQSGPQVPDGSVSELEDDEDYTTGDASLDNPRNQDGIGESERGTKTTGRGI